MRRMSAVKGSCGSKNARIRSCGLVRKKNMATMAATLDKPIVTQAVRRTAGQSCRAKALPARTVPACDNPICTMKLNAASCNTIPWAASSKCPSQPIIKADAANNPLSARAVAEIGTASRVTARAALPSNRQKRANICCSGKLRWM